MIETYDTNLYVNITDDDEIELSPMGPTILEVDCWVSCKVTYEKVSIGLEGDFDERASYEVYKVALDSELYLSCVEINEEGKISNVDGDINELAVKAISEFFLTDKGQTKLEDADYEAAREHALDHFEQYSVR